ncbi:pyridine nucleotide-disulfide oxidoreductase [Flavobacterium faecale]|uniref:Pyridine nucleotide-disulfide oxidoreductase n=1 Tax=Flavobacterium faecale TaxID=1355330 RepID=A0A2S1LBM5_9FLAO|nr:FAD-dependent oxidoreductase [Flavobacterium faecale]AWG21153.1 pyridine nucleotide-disulfide oxidoreductase [Flavobacterium faecale]
MKLDVLIIGGGVSSLSCALVLGSAQHKTFATDKKIAVLTHQKASALQDAIFYNAYGIPAGTLGSDLLLTSTTQLADTYPHITQIPNEKAIKIEGSYPDFIVTTNKNTYNTALVVIGIGSANTFDIEGLLAFVEDHKKALPAKQRIQLRNTDHKVIEGVYVTGTLAGWRSQLAIAAGSGASVATDILTLWNGGEQTHSHDSIREK